MWPTPIEPVREVPVLHLLLRTEPRLCLPEELLLLLRSAPEGAVLPTERLPPRPRPLLWSQLLLRSAPEGATFGTTSRVPVLHLLLRTEPRLCLPEELLLLLRSAPEGAVLLQRTSASRPNVGDESAWPSAVWIKPTLLLLVERLLLRPQSLLCLLK
jgi:hypothetical protein